MDRLTHIADFGLEDWDEILYLVKGDLNGAYNILDIARFQGKEEFDEILKNISLRLAAYEDTGLEPEKIKEILNAINGGLAAENGIWCPKCGDALDIDIVNGVLAIGCFGCGEYTPVSELMKLHLNDAVPVVRCKDCIKWEADESYEFDDDGTKKLWVDCSNSLHHCKDNHYCNYGERKESNE